ncbi:tetratricopeptide repeat protein [Niabella sp. CC-SYL272]|uniref:tetratricopeptide repeat protein n=1 Tax=Niabella agricola TaxID=2891571 RepID=UPI001F3E87D1|nr:tetratricopeptide repeat protein [Niabella agricola]MCF3107251.1 tetratricopeptide repeat protein [Niabella agricola]
MRWTHHKKTFLVLSSILLFFLGSLIIVRCSQPEKKSGEKQTVNDYMGDAACISCHKSEHDQWQLSDHFKAMQPANDSTVLGNFNNASYSADGVTSTFFKKDGKFFINTEGPDGKNHDYQIKYTFGYYPLQQYLVEFDRGRMQATRQSWNSKDKKWFHQYAGQKLAANDWLHWTGNGQNWNTMCAECHSTNLKKNYNSETDSYNTTYSVLTVSCEACHGPAKQHIDYINGDDYKHGTKQAGSYLRAPKNSSQLAQIQTCFPCHARKGNISADLKNSSEILDDYIPEIPSTEFFHADGQADDEDYTYASFLQSKMYKHGVKCSNCHNPHTGKLLIAGNGACLQCHDKKYDAPTHTFHPVNTAGSECKNCHMPGKFYMGNDWRHDHTFRVPRPDLSVQYGTPNACNNCHTNQPAAWAAAAVNKWYGPTRAYHFAEDLIPGSKMDAGSQAHLIKLIQDTATPPIIQATAVHYLSGVQDGNNPVAGVLRELHNTDAQVRYRAVTGLNNFAPALWRDAVQEMLTDKVRAVRIAAANLVLGANDADLIAGLGAGYTNALAELNDHVLYQTDFASGNIMAADYYLKLKNYDKAESFYLKGLQKDNQMNYARLNLSTVYNIKGNNQAALKSLEEAARIDPKNDRIYFNLALLYNELNQPDNVEKSLKKAIELKTQNPRVYYNYAILLQQQQQYKQAEQQYLKGLQLAPSDADINYALCVLHLQQNNLEAAKSYAATLKKYYPGDQRFFQLWQQLGML